jgi:hypothetical protein
MPNDDILKLHQAMLRHDKAQGKDGLRKAKVPLLKTPEFFEEITPNQKAAQSDAPPQAHRSHRPRLLAFAERSIDLGKSAAYFMPGAEHRSIDVVVFKSRRQHRQRIRGR